MKFSRYFGLALLLGASFPASAQQIDPMSKAMLNAYTELIKENPKDYQTYYERASQYYGLSLYDDALNDLTNALKYTPEKEKDLRMSELSLMADVAVQVGNYELALNAINEALEADPQNYANIYKKGNVLLYLQRPEEAYRIFSSLQSLKSRSQEAYFGMAKALIMQKNFNEAQELMKEAEAADPTGWLTFCRLGDLYVDMEQPENAATNYLVAFNLGSSSSSRPLESLMNLASTNYNAVATALDFAIEKADNKIATLFLKANLALESGNFTQAQDAFSKLLSYPDGRIAGVYAGSAKAKFALGDIASAVADIDNALNMQPSADYYILKSGLDVASGEPAKGVMDAQYALNTNPGSAEALIAKAEAQIALNDNKSALSTLNEAIMTAPDNMKALLLRAYVNDALGKGKQAVGDFNRINLEEASSFPAIAYKGIAKAKSGKKLDADAIVEKGLETNNKKDDCYWAAVYYAQTGNLEKAKELADKAVFDGYQNSFNLKSCSTPWLNLSPIRHLFK